MSQLRILVVGASIAGPTAAYWLAKTGASVTIIERFPRLRTNGHAIDIRTVGVTVMRKMPGMEEAVRAKRCRLDGLSWVRDDGRPYGTIRATGNPDQQSLVSEYEIFRGDLAEILYDLTKDNKNIKYIFNEQVASLQQSEKEDGPVTVEFANGLPTAAYDLVVACDGATSRTRAIGLSCGVRDHVTSINSWAAFFSLDHDLLNGSSIGQGYSAVGGRFVAVGPAHHNSTKSFGDLMGINPRTDNASMLPFREAQKAGELPLKRYIARKFRGAGWKTDEVIEGMMKATDFYANEIVQVKLPHIYKGRFTLVGDAGYAPGPTGGGTSLAIAGGYVLAGSLSKHKNDIPAALAAYEATMRPIITDLQKIPPLVPTVMAPQTAWGVWLRNHIFMVIAWSRLLEIVQRYWAPSFGGDKYGLPEYEWVE